MKLRLDTRAKLYLLLLGNLTLYLHVSLTRELLLVSILLTLYFLVSETIIIPSVAVIRFFPTIAEDYRQIRNAIALRGITYRNPMEALNLFAIALIYYFFLRCIDGVFLKW